MNLKDFLEKRDKPPELYWSLVIEKGWVQSGIWYIGEGAAEVIAVSPPAAWEEEDELVGACDAALSSSVAKLPENYEEPSKTVFGVASFWVKGGEITDEYLAKIKKVCTDLSLTPVGFVVLPEAIAHLFKSEDGTPLSAVIVGLGTDELEVSVFKLGNLVGTTTVARSVSLTDDVVEGLSRFEAAAPLPSRIVVYDGKGGELEDARDELTKANWDSKDEKGGSIKFLHTPKVEVLVSDRKVLATSLAGASEIGNISQVNSKIEDAAAQSNENLPRKEEIENVAPPPEATSAEDLGFVIGEDIAQKKQSVYQPIRPTPEIAFVKQPESSPALPVGNRNYLQKTKSLFHGFSSKFKIRGQAAAAQRNPRMSVYFVIALILLLVAGGAAYLWFVPKAVVTVYVSPKSYQEQVSLSFNSQGQFDESRALIPGSVISAAASGDKTKSTTGTKLVGDKAGGSVQVANGNGSPIHLSAGTILTSSGGLRFTTSAEASVSGQLIPGSPGTATVGVTAADIGAQYNLAKGEIFKVGVFDKSQVAATSQADFSGGSSQQIAAVSADDQKNLEDDLKNELTGQLLDQLSSKVNSDQVFVNDLSSQTVSDENFDHKVGDVADTLKLSLTLSATAVAADKAKLLQYATGSLKNKIPQGFALRNSQINFKFGFVGEKDGNLNYNADIKANFLPLIDINDLTKKISGKSTPVVENYLSTIPGYSRAEVKIQPNLPGPFALLPRVGKNITIEVASEQ